MRIRLDIWLLGLPLVAAIAGAAAWRIAPEIEADLRAQVQAGRGAIERGQLGRAGARVEVEGRDLAVTTDAPLAQEGRAEGERLAKAVPGLRGTLLREVPPAAAHPFTFAVRQARDGLVLSGFVTPGDLRAELLDEARAGGVRVRDDLRSALGAPAGFEQAARLLVRATRRLERSDASVSDRSISVSGSAPDPETYREAVALLRSPPAGYSVAAAAITPPLVRPYSWSAARENGSTILAGHVPSEEERRSLMAAAGEAGAGPIEDRMDTARGLESGLDFDAVARRGLAVLARLESGRVELKGRALTIEGRLAARDLLDTLRRDLESARLPGVELGRVDLQPVVPRPYRLSARRQGGRLVLAGFVPAEADRAAIRELVQRRFPLDAISDDLHLADGAPEGLLPAARLALERLAALGEGYATIEDRRVRLSGLSPYAELAERTQREFASAMPAGWTAAADVTAIPDKPLDPDFCGDLVADSASREPVRFETGKDELGPPARKALTAIAGIMRRCGAARLAVVSRIESAGDAEPARELAARRAAVIVAALGEMGVRKAEPEASAEKVSDPAKARERITFEVRP